MKKNTKTSATGFDSPHAIRRMNEIEAEARAVSVVKHPTMIVVADATENSLETAIVFIKAGTPSMDAVSRAAENGIRNAHERSRFALPDDWEADDHGLYWDQPYIF